MAGLPWTDEHKAIVLEEGISLEEAARRTGRTPAAVQLQARKLGKTIYSERTLQSVREQEYRSDAQNEPETNDTPDLDRLLDLADEFDLGDDPTPEQIERLLDVMTDMDSALQSFSPTKDRVEFSPPESHLPTGIVYTGDWHVGAGGVALDRLREDLKRIGETDGLWAIGMGDMIEGVGAGNKAAPPLYHGLVNSSAVQVSIATHLARHAEGKWLALLGGNHDAFSFRATGIERARVIAQRLGVPFFSEAGGTIYLNLDGASYVIGVRHNGKGNSQINTTNAQRRTFDQWPEWENVDVICLAHLHYNDLQVTPRKGGQCVYLRSGTAKVHDDYSRDQGYKPEYGMPLVVFYPGEKRMIPFRGDQLDAGLRFLAMERARYQREAA